MARPKMDPAKRHSETLVIRVTAKEREGWRAKATADGWQNLSDWIRSVLDRAARM